MRALHVRRGCRSTLRCRASRPDEAPAAFGLLRDQAPWRCERPERQRGARRSELDDPARARAAMHVRAVRADEVGEGTEDAERADRDEKLHSTPPFTDRTEPWRPA